MPRGRAARFAYDPAVICAFVDAHKVYAKHGRHGRICSLLNGHPINDIHKRTLRRWRTQEGVTRRGLVTLLRSVQIPVADFENWALDQGLNPFKRNQESI